jgi:phosphoribosylformimino-5-aminoimidazole carboxamide ribotide isomerase
MQLIPSIDLYNGQCVRLYQGKFDEMTVYKQDPLELAQYYESQGVRRLHLVDLNGAQTGEPANLKLIAEIAKLSQCELQLGGGLRSEAAIEYVLNQGIDSVVLGSLMVRSPTLCTTLIKKYGSERFVIALDVFIDTEPMLAVSGWQEKSVKTLWQQLDALRNFERMQILCTDISRDGTLDAPNFDLYALCIARYPELRFQASGGISDLNQLIQLQQTGLSAAIIGKALYEDPTLLNLARAEEVLC